VGHENQNQPGNLGFHGIEGQVEGRWHWYAVLTCALLIEDYR
jgi:hypothetical protein